LKVLNAVAAFFSVSCAPSLDIIYYLYISWQALQDTETPNDFLLFIALMTTKLPRKTTKAILLAWAVLLCWTRAACAGDNFRNDVWLIDTRLAPVCGDFEKGKENIRYWRLNEQRTWMAGDAASFAKSGESNPPTHFLVHGNRTDPNGAVEFAWPFCRWLDERDEKTHRVVIWSWPSEQTHRRHRPDAQTKVFYCDSQSYYIADCLQCIKPETPVSMIGYSFGARIITGGLHLLGGGEIEGSRLPTFSANVSTPESVDISREAKKRTLPIRAVLVAAALDCHALASNGEYGFASSQSEELLVTENRCDTVLKFYPLLYGRGGPQAIGRFGPCCIASDNVKSLDVTCCVGKTHDWECYFYCPCFLESLPHYVFLNQPKQ
jgi:hypothetical protein